MELLILSIIFYSIGKNAALLGSKNEGRFRFLANFAASLFFILFVLGILKYGISHLLAEAFGNSAFFQMSGMLLVWGGYMLRVKTMGNPNTGSPYADILNTYKHFPYKKNVLKTGQIIVCDFGGLVFFSIWIFHH